MIFLTSFPKTLVNIFLYIKKMYVLIITFFIVTNGKVLIIAYYQNDVFLVKSAKLNKKKRNLNITN